MVTYMTKKIDGLKFVKWVKFISANFVKLRMKSEVDLKSLLNN